MPGSTSHDALHDDGFPLVAMSQSHGYGPPGCSKARRSATEPGERLARGATAARGTEEQRSATGPGEGLPRPSTAARGTEEQRSAGEVGEGLKLGFDFRRPEPDRFYPRNQSMSHSTDSDTRSPRATLVRVRKDGFRRPISRLA